MSEERFPHLFQPIDLGPMRLRNRIMVPPHGSGIGNLWGTPEQAEQHISYWESRILDGAAWMDGVRGRVQNHSIPGFETGGYGAETLGNYRQPNYVERVSELVARINAAGGVASSQLTVIGGVPHAPATKLSSPISNSRPHVMTVADIAWYVAEYKFCAEQARRAGLDGIELHLNHDDMLEWFLSPLTNQRDDAYGGTLAGRARFAVEALQAVRDAVGGDLAVGVRFNMREEVPGGYDLDGGLEVAQLLEATGLVDFLHCVVGSPWGDPSYIQPQFHEPAQWADLAGQVRSAVSLPIVHAGRINSLAVAEQVVAAGNADVVGIARGYLAERDLVTKERAGLAIEVRPCIGGNDCISRQYAEGLPFGCAVNPHVATEFKGRWGQQWGVAPTARTLLVVGGGPAGMELAALAAESGHTVELWEAVEELGGQLATAALAPTYEKYREYLDWQVARLARVGVAVHTGRRASAEGVVAHGADVVALATGATPHTPRIPGIVLPHVVQGTDVLRGEPTGDRVLVVAQDDHLAPLALADHLRLQGKQVTLLYGSAAPAQHLGRYILGSILARLRRGGVEFRHLSELVGVSEHAVTVRDVYTWESEELTGFDTVALSCGGDSEAALHAQLLGRVPELHLLGDAYAPRRLSFATRQAAALADLLAAPVPVTTSAGEHR